MKYLITIAIVFAISYSIGYMAFKPSTSDVPYFRNDAQMYDVYNK